MQTALDAPTEALNQDEQSFVSKVREFGWFRTAVSADAEGPGFSYTTGLWVSTQNPELIIFGMPKSTHDVFWGLFRDAKVGRCLPIGTRTGDIFGNFAAYAFPVAKSYYSEYLGWNQWFYAGDDFPCLQIVWPDPAGFFPWEGKFDSALMGSQPDLTENGWMAGLAH